MADDENNQQPVELPELLDRPAPPLEVKEDGIITFGDEQHAPSS